MFYASYCGEFDTLSIAGEKGKFQVHFRFFIYYYKNNYNYYHFTNT